MVHLYRTMLSNSCPRFGITNNAGNLQWHSNELEKVPRLRAPVIQRLKIRRTEKLNLYRRLRSMAQRQTLIGSCAYWMQEQPVIA